MNDDTTAKSIARATEATAKLGQTIASGIGVIGNSLFRFDTRQMQRRSKAECDALKAKAIAKIDSETITILGRAKNRMLLDQINKQFNLEEVITQANTLLVGKLVNKTPVDHDWSARFINVAQDISDREIQDILANILAGEVTNPGKNSKRLLEFLHTTSKEELGLFSRFIAISSDIGLYTIGRFDSTILSQYDLIVNDIRDMADIGLVTFDRDLSSHVDFEENTTQEIIYNDRIIRMTSPISRKMEIGIIPLTKTGQQLYSVMKKHISNIYRDKYFTDLVKYLSNLGIEVKEIKLA